MQGTGQKQRRQISDLREIAWFRKQCKYFNSFNHSLGFYIDMNKFEWPAMQWNQETKWEYNYLNSQGKLTGLDHGFEPEAIIGMSISNQKLHFKVLYKHGKHPEYVPGQRMRHEFPQVGIIEYTIKFTVIEFLNAIKLRIASCSYSTSSWFETSMPGIGCKSVIRRHWSQDVGEALGFELKTG
jgi:hypothetical protein